MHENSSGQALLLVLLSVGVIITIALSVVSRSVSDIGVSTKDEESLRAFSAAEAGVEEILKQPIASLPTDGNAASPVTVGAATTPTNYTALTASYPENRREFLYPTELLSGDTATVWLSEHDQDNPGTLTCSGGSNIKCYQGDNVRMCWGKTGVDITQQPAVVVSVLYEDMPPGRALKYAYAAYDPNTSRQAQNKFTGGAFTSLSTNTSYGTQTFGGTRFATCGTLQLGAGGLNLPSGVISGRRLKAMTVMFLYNTTPTVFGVTGLPSDLPIQGRRIDSTGVSGESSRKVQVYALYPEIPTMFQAAIFSPPGVVK